MPPRVFGGVEAVKTVRAIVVLVMVAATMIGCSRKEDGATPVRPAKIFATQAYERYFGPVPAADKGTAYAFVIFFPSAKDPSKVVPFPFFTFDEGSMKKVAVERLLSGMEVGSYRGEFIPVASGVRLVSISEDQGKVTLEFNKELSPSHGEIFAKALILTLRQFAGVKEVRLRIEGQKQASTPLDVDGSVQQPSAPRLLSVTAMRDKGAAEIEDVNAFFDRPVEVRALKLLQPNGESFAGDLFHSVFDMAAVLKPKDRSRFKAGMPVKVRWQVVDKLGRQAEGDSVWSLEIKEH